MTSECFVRRTLVTSIMAATLMLWGSVVVFGQCINPPNTTMVAWYPFDESTGTTAENLATGNSGTEVGAPTHITGNVGGALHFTGNVPQYVNSPSTIMTNFGPAGIFPFSCSGVDSSCYGNFAIDLWIRVPVTLDLFTHTILDKRAANVGYTFALYSRRLVMQLADNQAGAGYTTFVSPVIPTLYNGLWHHIAVSVIRLAPPGFAAPEVDFYHNGGAPLTPVATSDNNPRTGSLVNGSVLRIGANTFNPVLGYQFIGDMDELEIYNRDLTAAEVQGIYSAGSSGKCKP